MARSTSRSSDREQQNPSFMSLELWSRAKPLFERVHQLPPPARQAVLAETCDGDDALRAEVERLLRLDGEADGFFGAFRDDLQLQSSGVALPDRVGPWRVVREVGRGGMGCVLLAERDDGAFEQRVAVKLVESVAPGLVRRFQRERRILASLDHPHIASLLDGGRLADGRPYLVMEYVEGEPITDYAASRNLSVDARLDLVQEVCEALAYSHRKLVVHRDLKPSNIFVADDESGRPRVKLLDFGIARLLSDEDGGLTRTNHRVYTPVYAAPEQIKEGLVTTSTDVYALGVLLYQLLTGDCPFSVEGGSARQIEEAVIYERPAAPSKAVVRSVANAKDAARLSRRLRGDLDRIVLKAIRKEPERRYHSVDALAQDIARHRAHLPIAARPPTLQYRTWRFIQRHRAGVGLAAVLLVALVFGLVWRVAVHSYDRYQRYPFADRVVSYDHRGTVTYPPARDPSAALQMPGHRSKLGGEMVALGFGGVLVLEFTDNVLADGPGVDLVVWEGGADVEMVDVAVSEDGHTFFPLGSTATPNHAFDLAPLGRPEARYRFVRLTDVIEPGEDTEPQRSAGADIRAVFAANGGLSPPRPAFAAVASLGRTLRTMFQEEREANVELLGGDFDETMLESGGAPACQQLCLDEPVCRSWTFISAEAESTGRCQLKAFVPPPLYCAYCTSGIARP